MERAQDLIKQQLSRCQTELELHPKDELLLKAIELCKHALSKAQSSDEGCRKEVLQSYAQSLLDSTYRSECQLVEREFPKEDVKQEIEDIISTLSNAAQACGSPEGVPLLLGDDLLECLHWRVGALLYMYCHTVIESEKRTSEMDHSFVMECCRAGVGHLQLMLTCRAPLDSDTEVTSLDSSTPLLLRQGIFSDVHMLALMYAGELCYWCWELQHKHTESGSSKTSELQSNPQATQTTQSESNSKEKSPTTMSLPNTGPNTASFSSTNKDPSLSDSEALSEELNTPPLWLYRAMEHTQGREYTAKWMTGFNSVQLGLGFLSKYVEVSRGPLKSQGWKYDRAVQLLVKLKKTGS